MHACAGQLDMRKLSGLKGKMPVTCWLMFVGCLALAGFPLTAGFFSKDAILAATLEAGIGESGRSGGGSMLFVLLAVLGLFTALLTAFYTFRLWFRVFLGPEQFEMGDEGHAHGDEGAATSVAAHGEPNPHDDANAHATIAVERHHEPHEMPWLMNGPLVVLAVGSVVAGFAFHGWVQGVIEHSTANPQAAAHVAAEGAGAAGDAHHATILGMSVHTAMMLLSGVIAIVGIVAAAWFHWLDRESAMLWARRYKGVVTLLHNKWYVDEVYDAMIVRPLRGVAHLCYLFDRLVIDGLVAAVAFAPRVLGLSIRPMQRGALQGYGLGMLAGAAAIVLLVWMAWNRA
jgi:NADH-quinone oxidoreductase subunit L